VVNLDGRLAIFDALSKLIANLLQSPSKGARVRGGAGSRRKPSFDSVNVSSRILSLDFHDQERKADVVTITVDNFDLTQFDEPLFKRGDIIEYSFGYYDRMAPIREAVVRKVTGSTVLTVEAHSKDVIMDQVKRRISYENKTRSEIIREVAFRNGYTEESVHIEDTAEVFEVVTQSNLTDAQFIRKMANKQGCEFFVDYDGFHWHTRNLSQAPITRLVYYTDDRQGDIISFNIENDLTRKPSRVRVRGVNPQTGETIEAVADDKSDSNRDALQPEPGTKQPIFEIDKFVDGLKASYETTKAKENEAPGTTQHDVSERPVNTIEEAETHAKKIFRKASQRAVKMQLNLVGDATIVGKSVILIEGMGKRLSGRYYIKNIRHSIRGGGTYTMTAELITDGFGSTRKRGSKAGRDPAEDIRSLIAEIARCARGLPEPFRTMVDQKVRQVSAVIASKDGFNGNGYKPASRIADQINTLVLPGFNPESSSQQALKDKIMNLVAKLVALCLQAAYNSNVADTTEARVNDKSPSDETGDAFTISDAVDGLFYIVGG
jgi:phage protein D